MKKQNNLCILCGCTLNSYNKTGKCHSHNKVHELKPSSHGEDIYPAGVVVFNDSNLTEEEKDVMESCGICIQNCDCQKIIFNDEQKKEVKII